MKITGFTKGFVLACSLFVIDGAFCSKGGAGSSSYSENRKSEEGMQVQAVVEEIAFPVDVQEIYRKDLEALKSQKDKLEAELALLDKVYEYRIAHEDPSFVNMTMLNNASHENSQSSSDELSAQKFKKNNEMQPISGGTNKSGTSSSRYIWRDKRLNVNEICKMSKKEVETRKAVLEARKDLINEEVDYVTLQSSVSPGEEYISKVDRLTVDEICKMSKKEVETRKAVLQARRNLIDEEDEYSTAAFLAKYCCCCGTSIRKACGYAFCGIGLACSAATGILAAVELGAGENSEITAPTCACGFMGLIFSSVGSILLGKSPASAKDVVKEEQVTVQKVKDDDEGKKSSDTKTVKVLDTSALADAVIKHGFPNS